MTDVRATVSVDTSSVKEGTNDLNRFAAAGKEAARGVEQAERATRSSSGSTANLNREIERLVNRYDATFAAANRYEQELRQIQQAQAQGIGNAQQLARVQRILETRLQASSNAALQNQRAFRGFRGSLQNASFQIQDIAVQLAAGTSAAQTFGQQLPQLLGAYGTIGAVAGAAVAVVGGLATAFVNSGDSAESAADKIEDFTRVFDVLSLSIGTTSDDLFAFEKLLSNVGEANRPLALAVLNGQLQETRKTVKEFIQGDELDRVSDFFSELRDLTRTDPSFGQVDDARFRRQFELLEDASSLAERQQILKNLINLTDEYGFKNTELAAIIGELAEVILQEAEAFDKVKNAQDASLSSLTKIGPAITFLSEEIRVENEFLLEQAELYEQGRIGLEELERAKEIYSIQQQLGRELTAEENALLEEQLLIRDQIKEKIEKETEARAEAKKEVEKLAAAQKKEQEAFLKDVRGEFRTIFSDAFDDVGGAFENLLDRFRDRFTDFLADLAFEAIAKPIIVGAGVGGGSGSQTTSVGGVTLSSGGGVGDIVGNLSNIFSSSGTLGTQFVNSSVGQFFGLNPAGSNFAGIGSSVQSGLNTLSSPIGAIGGFAGNLGANLLFGDDRGIGASIGGTAGSVLASIVLAGTPLAPFAPFIGSFVGNALGGLFGGGEPANVTGTSAITFGGSQVNEAVNDASAEQIAAAGDLARNITNTVKGFSQVAGIDFGDELALALNLPGANRADPGSIGIGRVTNTSTLTSAPGFGAGNQQILSGDQIGRADLTSNEAIVARAIEVIFGADEVQTAFSDAFENVSADVQSVLDDVENIIDSTNVEESVTRFGERLAFAAGFEDALDALTRGTTTFGESLSADIDTAFDNLITQIQDFREEAELLPDGLERANPAIKTFVERFLGIQDAADVLTESEQAELIRNAQIENANRLLEEAGFTTEEVNERIEKYVANLDAQARALETVNVALPILTDLIGTLQTGQQTSLLSALNDLAGQARETAEDLFGAADTLRQARDDLLLDPSLSTLGPIERLTEAERQFLEVLGAARGGDLAAIERLPDISRAFLEASREVNASGPGFAEDFRLVREALDEIADSAEGRGDVLLNQANGLDAASVAIDRFFRTVSETVADGIISADEQSTIQSQLAAANSLVVTALGPGTDGLAGKITLALTDIRNAVSDGIIDENELAILQNNLGGAVDAVLAEVNRLIAGLIARAGGGGSTPIIPPANAPLAPGNFIDGQEIQGPPAPPTIPGETQGPPAPSPFTLTGGIEMNDAAGIVEAVNRNTQAVVLGGQQQTFVLGSIDQNTREQAKTLVLNAASLG